MVPGWRSEMTNDQTFSTIGPFSVREDKRSGGFYEISVSMNGSLVAVISRQCVGGKWCLYPAAAFAAPIRFKTKQAALTHATSI
jgi:hypothetical protein